MLVRRFARLRLGAMTVSAQSRPGQRPYSQTDSSRDFRSDTVTTPLDDWFDAMKAASRGDDVYGDNETMNRFEAKIAKMTGKEAGLFCTSGTQTNQIALRTHFQQPPHSLICDSRSHIFRYEAGGAALFSQAQIMPIEPSNKHHITAKEVESALVLGDDVHTCPTRLIHLENTLAGTVLPQDEVQEIAKVAERHDIRLHLDGARIWHVAALSDRPAEYLRELCQPFDSISLCLSKGIGAPIGSVLVGPSAFIKKARWFRKMFGGGTRQSGMLAAAADQALQTVFPEHLKRSHDIARDFAERVNGLGCQLLIPTETNMVFLDPLPAGVAMQEIIEKADEDAIRLGGNRIVFHWQTDEKAVDRLVEIIKSLISEARSRKGTPADAFEHADALKNGLQRGAKEVKKHGVPYAGN